MGKTWFALITEGPHPTRKPGSATPSELEYVSDLPVHTLCVWSDSGGVKWPVERWEGSLASWELEGRRIA